MNSHLKSEGKKFRLWRIVTFFIAGPLLLSSIGCQTGEKSRTSEWENPAKYSQELSEEVSLKSDRSQLEELRKEIPQETKVANDELAFDLELMGKANKQPYEIRNVFQGKVRKIRERFRQKSQDVRKKFRDTQKKQRDQVLEQLKTERGEFKKQKPDREQNKEFFAKQDRERKDFFEKQKDQRKEFESDMQQKSKDFHANMRERVDQFNEQLRLYTKSFNEKKKYEEDLKKSKAREQKRPSGQGPFFKKDPQLDAETKKIMNEFEDMKSIPSEPLKK
ncbi:MAG: hypothetical protein KDD34_02205 [Bdellovibrionales bacterium]|nr:hypothetical protein [Bdellovibrionales bacterium]